MRRWKPLQRAAEEAARKAAAEAAAAAVGWGDARLSDSIAAGSPNGGGADGCGDCSGYLMAATSTKEGARKPLKLAAKQREIDSHTCWEAAPPASPTSALPTADGAGSGYARVSALSSATAVAAVPTSATAAIAAASSAALNSMGPPVTVGPSAASAAGAEAAPRTAVSGRSASIVAGAHASEEDGSEAVGVDGRGRGEGKLRKRAAQAALVGDCEHDPREWMQAVAAAAGGGGPATGWPSGGQGNDASEKPARRKRQKGSDDMVVLTREGVLGSDKSTAKIRQLFSGVASTVALACAQGQGGDGGGRGVTAVTAATAATTVTAAGNGHTPSPRLPPVFAADHWAPHGGAFRSLDCLAPPPAAAAAAAAAAAVVGLTSAVAVDRAMGSASGGGSAVTIQSGSAGGGIGCGGPSFLAWHVNNVAVSEEAARAEMEREEERRMEERERAQIEVERRDGNG